MFYTSSEAPPRSIVGRLHDAHCHPTTGTGEPGAIDVLRSVEIGSIVAMSTTVQDQQEVEDLAESDRARVVPAFGFHPWATHAIKLDPTTSKRSHYCSVFLTPKSPASHQQILDEILTFLPEPKSLTELLVDLERRLRRWPRAQLGEVGLDKKARVPIPELFRNQVASNSNGQEIDKEEENLAWLRSRSLTPYVTSMDHQMAILQAQVDVLHRVVEDEGRSRCISLHAVGVSAPVDQLLSKWTKDWAGLPALIKVLLHSCGLSWEAWQSIERKSPNVYVSISPLLLNPPRPPTQPRPKIASLFAQVHQDRILIESDHSDLWKNEHSLWEVVKALAEGRVWGGNPDEWEALNEGERIDRVVSIVEHNFKEWVG